MSVTQSSESGEALTAQTDETEGAQKRAGPPVSGYKVPPKVQKIQPGPRPRPGKTQTPPVNKRKNNYPPKTRPFSEQSAGFGELLKKGGYEIQVTYAAIAEIAGCIYDGIHSYDHKFSPPSMTRDMFIHVNQFAVLVRHLYIQHKLKHLNEAQFPILLTQVSSLSTLPFHNVIATYLESIGLAEVDGLCAYPHHDNLSTVIEDIGFRKMERNEKQRLVFVEPPAFLTDVEDIIRGVDLDVYAQCTRRVANMSASFRTIDWYNTAGSVLLFVSHYHDAVEQNDYGVSTANIALEKYEMGSVCQFWTTNVVRDRGDFTQFPYRFKGKSHIRSRVLVDVIESTLDPRR